MTAGHSCVQELVMLLALLKQRRQILCRACAQRGAPAVPEGTLCARFYYLIVEETSLCFCIALGPGMDISVLGCGNATRRKCDAVGRQSISTCTNVIIHCNLHARGFSHKGSDDAAGNGTYWGAGERGVVCAGVHRAVQRV